MSAPAFDKSIWGRPNPARWRARQDAAAAAAAEPPPHGHGEHACDHCPKPESCDCACDHCVRSRHVLAGTACATCGSLEGITAGACATCRGDDVDMEEPPQEPTKPKSWIQKALDDEWAAANFDGPGCPFCDAMFSCDCWARRAEMIEAEYRREQRERRAAPIEGECTCEEDMWCDHCRAEEANRCDECGAPAGEPCRPGCGDRGEEEEEEDRDSQEGYCPGCSPGCYGCDPYFDPSDPWGDGAPEEHPGHPAYDGY